MPRPKKGRTQLERALVGPAGEHYVLFKLHVEGMLAALAPRNAPSVDILVFTDEERIAATVQVKTRTYGTDGGWHMSKKHETLVRPKLFYAFVDLEPASPVTFVVPSKVVAEVIKEAHLVWLKTPGQKGQDHNDHDMRRVLPSYGFSVRTAPARWMDQYRDRWDLLRPG